MNDDWGTARVVHRVDWADGLATLRFDCALPPFEAGQYVNLALFVEERRLKRSYSLASAPGEPPEVFLRRVDDGALTPRIFALGVGEELLVERKPRGLFTLKHVPDAATLWLFATGTGLGPFVGMLRTEEPWRRFGRVVVAHGVRVARDLAYRDELRAHPRLTWIPVLSRDPEVADALHGRIPAALADGRLEARAGVEIRPDDTQVMLCGSPAMLDDVERALEGRGLTKSRPKRPGHIHVERYW
jgi:ferredoxin--NADP+ reductase